MAVEGISSKPLDPIWQFVRTPRIFLVSLVVFIILLFVLPHPFISSDLGNTILTISTFLFGLIAGFYIVVTTTDYNSIKSILADETASWIILYQNLNEYDTAAAKKLAKALDVCLRRSFDFEIIDYARGTLAEFKLISKIVNDVTYQVSLSSLYQEIRGTWASILATRQKLVVLGSKTLSAFQWIILFALALLVVTSLYGLRTGELFFDIVTVFIASSIVLILLLIRDLDLYIWNEKTFGYDIFENVFEAIGFLPYYPTESVRKGRVHPTESEYRLGTLIDPLKSSQRKVTIQKHRTKH